MSSCVGQIFPLEPNLCRRSVPPLPHAQILKSWTTYLGTSNFRRQPLGMVHGGWPTDEILPKLLKLLAKSWVLACSDVSLRSKGQSCVEPQGFREFSCLLQDAQHTIQPSREST